MDLTLHRRRLVLWVLGAAMLAAALALAATGPAWAQPPVTFTQVEKFSESFTDTFHCVNNNEPYYITVVATDVRHVTAAGIDEDGNEIPPFHEHSTLVGKVVAVPADGTGPTYVGHFNAGFQHNVRFDGPAITFTDRDKVTAKGSDGSRLNFHLLERITVSANGELTVDFLRVRGESC
jgi:hypothetical protein